MENEPWAVFVEPVVFGPWWYSVAFFGLAILNHLIVRRADPNDLESLPSLGVVIVVMLAGWGALAYWGGPIGRGVVALIALVATIGTGVTVRAFFFLPRWKRNLLSLWIAASVPTLLVILASREGMFDPVGL